MLSDRGISRAVANGRLLIEPFDYGRLTPCSYELEMERIWRIEKPHLDKDHYSMEEFIERCCKPYDGALLPGMNYIGMSREKVLSVARTDVTMRSGVARLGIRAVPIPRDRDNASDRLYFHISTFDTTCEIPEGVSMVQAYFDAHMPLARAELEAVLASGKMGFDGCLVPENDGRFYTETPHSILMRMGSGMKRYNGGILRYGANNDACFDEIGTDEMQFLPEKHFHLAHTEERVEMPEDFAGIIRRLPADFGFGYIDPNSVLVMPGTGHPIVLEMYFPQGRSVLIGAPICRMDLHRLDQLPEKLYNGRHQNQKGPQTSLSHMD